jgi:hypothetical protein
MTDNDRYAMLIGVSTYDSDAYHDLPPVRADLHYMQAVLESTEIGMFNDCAMVAEPTRAEMMRAIETFLEERQPSETALLYFSGHGEFCDADNQLYFLTRDTDPDDLPGTAVPADFLERTLSGCRASAKLVLLDCCASGSVVQGWTAKGTRGPDEQPVRSTLLRPAGVYFITASDALQPASAMAPPGSTLGTSRFTGEIVEGLRTGRITGDGRWITPDDLFGYLTAQMTRSGVPEEQRPTKSTIRARGNLPFARSVARPVRLPVLRRDVAEAARVSPALEKARQLAARDARDGIDWERLLRYYVHCLSAEAAASMMPDHAKDRNTGYFLLSQGQETIQSGLSSAFPAPAELPKPQARTGTAFRDAEAQREYWYGYPAVTLPVQEGNSRGRRSPVKIAPLLLQPMELAPDETGRDVLRPTGVPSLHPGLVSELLDEDDAANLLAGWQPAWQEGNNAQMMRAVRELLKQLELPELEPLDPSALSPRTVMEAHRRGAHNAAVLLTPSGAAATFTQALMDNLLEMAGRTGEITGTALEALLNDGAADAATGAAPTVVAPGPCNESQQEVISAAMTRRLTVATGPPGTGKSEVVTAVVTTCVAAGQSVLVASTNNEAVNVVADRCDAIAPGLLMRTGNSEALEREAAKLERLLRQPGPGPRRRSATVAGELRNTRATAAGQHAEAAQRVGEETRLLTLLREREERAGALEMPVTLLENVWATGSGTAALERWEGRARKAAGAPSWRLGPWRRARTLAALVEAAGAAGGADPSWPAWARERPVPTDLLRALADAVAVERQRRELVHGHTGWDEEQLKQRRLETTEALAELSTELSQARSAEALSQAEALMGQRLQALRRRSGFQKSQRNLMARLKGWAITNLSVRQLELTPKLFDLVVIDEASQCSVPSVLPLLFRAKRALIIGDPMQLNHIAPISPHQERQARLRAGLSATQLEEHRLTYHVHSAYHAAEHHTDSALLLDEHYRCHPAIADVVNGYCYAGRLQVLTDPRRGMPALDPVGAADSAPVLGWVDVPDGASARGGDGRSWRNEAEISAVRRVVDTLLAGLPEGATVGVVTPFRAQKNALERLWRDDARVRVGTVHAFQGQQRDIMVLSPVATPNTPPSTTHWVASQVNLWNVAITRAKSQLITVGSLRFWQAQSGLPAILAERSVPLGTGDGRSAGRTVGSGSAGGASGAAPAAGSMDSWSREGLTDRLQRYLGKRGITDLEREAVVGGHPVDVVFTVEGQNTAVLVDMGPPPGRDPARHLRLMHARENLLTGLPSGGHGAKAGEVRRTLRIPAWRIAAGEEALAELLD